MSQNIEIVPSEDPAPEDRAAILKGLVAYNDATFGASDIRQLAVLIRDETGATIGGLWGRTTFGWLYVELLFVPEILRGQGTGARLMADAEQIARGRGCANAYVDCFGEDNRGFYERSGYEVFGSLDGMPSGSVRYFLRKGL